MERLTCHFDFGRGPQQLAVLMAASARERMRGLLGRPALAPNEAMLLRACRLIHTFGMGYRLDLVYLGRDGEVLKVTHDLPARRIDGHWRAHSVLEMAAGAAARCGIAAGRTLLFEAGRTGEQHAQA